MKSILKREIEKRLARARAVAGMVEVAGSPVADASAHGVILGLQVALEVVEAAEAAEADRIDAETRCFFDDDGDGDCPKCVGVSGGCAKLGGPFGPGAARAAQREENRQRLKNIRYKNPLND